MDKWTPETAKSSITRNAKDYYDNGNNVLYVVKGQLGIYLLGAMSYLNNYTDITVTMLSEDRFNAAFGTVAKRQKSLRM